MTSFDSTPCSADELLPADAGADDVRRFLRRAPHSVVPIRDAATIVAADAFELRTAAHLDRLGPAVAELARPDLVHASAEDARAWLDADPTRPGAVVAGSRPVRIERATAPVRTAIVMAGGLGSRLRPLTDDTPKPLLEVGGRVLLYRILDHLQHHGFDRVFVSVNYLADRVKEAVGDGSDWGMDVAYLEEDEPLDTGAGLALLDAVDEPFVIINGDILTTLNLRALVRWHQLAGNLATVVTHRFAAPLPYGVVHRDGSRIADIEEKPVYRYDINAGIYAFAPDVLSLVEKGKPLAMVDFLNAQARATDRVRAFPVVEYWNDVGTHADFERAQTEVLEL